MTEEQRIRREQASLEARYRALEALEAMRKRRLRESAAQRADGGGGAWRELGARDKERLLAGLAELKAAKAQTQVQMRDLTKAIKRIETERVQKKAGGAPREPSHGSAAARSRSGRSTRVATRK